MSQEKLIYPPTVYQYTSRDEGAEIPYSLYEDAMARKAVGDTIQHDAGGPGIGSIRYRITRMDATGVYGEVLFNTMREMTPEEAM